MEKRGGLGWSRFLYYLAVESGEGGEEVESEKISGAFLLN